MNATDLKSLHGRSVLVKSASDPGRPPAGLRGTLNVRDSDVRGPMVSVGVEFPQMFQTPAHHREIVLSDEDVDRLLASERGGVFEFRLADELI